MSNREKCMAVIDSMDDTQLAHIAAMLEAAKQAIEDAADDAYCEKLHQDYENDPDKGDPMPITEFARSLGVQL